MKKPILIQIIQESASLHENKNNKIIKGFFIFQDELMNIFARTSSTESGVIRLKWFYDTISSKKISLIEIKDQDKKYLTAFLDSLSSDNFENLQNYIESFLCVFERRVFASIANEFIECCARYLDKIFQHIYSEASCKKLAYMYSANFFLINKIIFLENGWEFCKENNFRIQIDEIKQKKLDLQDDLIKNKSTKTFYKTNKYFFNKTISQEDIFWDLKINPGFLKIASIYYYLF